MPYYLGYFLTQKVWDGAVAGQEFHIHAFTFGNLQAAAGKRHHLTRVASLVTIKTS